MAPRRTADGHHELLIALDGCVVETKQEKADIERLRGFVSRCHPWSRESLLHITGSALVVHPRSQRVLLRWHHRQHSWIQVGGHADAGETDPWTVGLREATEETGLRDLAAWPPTRSPRPVQVVIVGVPAGGDEPAHEHGDIRYLLATNTPELALAESDQAPLRWLHLDEAEAEATEENVRELLRRARELLA